jgi:membrane protein
MARQSADVKPSDRSAIRQRLRRGMEAGKAKYTGSSAEYLWNRLSAMDFMNRGMQFAATLLLLFIPFVLVLSALEGRSAAARLSKHLGLNQQAAADVGHLVNSSSATSGAVTGLAWAFFVLSGIAVAGALQGLYEHIFGLSARGVKDTHRRLIWLAFLVGWLFVTGLVGPAVRSAGPAVSVVVSLIGFILFGWSTMWFLLGGRVSWRRLVPPAIATGVFWLGMEAVFSVILSGMITSNNEKYGPVGVMFALMSYLIAVGVVIILGAVVGLAWQDRNLSFRAAFRKLRRTR